MLGANEAPMSSEASRTTHHAPRTTSGAPAVVKVQDVSRDYRMGAETIHAVNGVSLAIDAGEYVAIAGPSGCGKSTLLNLMGAIDRPTAGTVSIQARRIDAMSDREATRFRLLHIGFVFQRFYLMPTLTARENVELPMAEAGVAKSARRDRARELLRYVGLEPRERHRPAQLSGGEQQRVAIARALANRPALLLADEPTGELDARTGAEVIALFGRLNRDGTTIVVVTHDEGLAGEAGRVVHMRDGKIVDEVRGANEVRGARSEVREHSEGDIGPPPRACERP
jgi:putative ABC transport system ATP-binding protein